MHELTLEVRNSPTHRVLCVAGLCLHVAQLTIQFLIALDLGLQFDFNLLLDAVGRAYGSLLLLVQVAPTFLLGLTSLTLAVLEINDFLLEVCDLGVSPSQLCLAISVLLC